MKNKNKKNILIIKFLIILVEIFKNLFMKKFILSIFISFFTILSTFGQDTFSTIDTVVCDTYIAPDMVVYSSSGIYTAIIPNANLNDSIITINLTVNGFSTSTIFETVCSEYMSSIGEVYTSSGQYTFTIENGNTLGCDSIVTLDLIILDASTSSITESSCVPFIAPDGQSIMQSGIYTAIIPNAAGCDSTITIDFTATNPTIDRIETVCGMFTNENGDLYQTSGVYMYSKAGEDCDTLVTLDLTIVSNSTNSMIEESVCTAFIAPDGQEFTTSGMYEVTIPNAAGCDSVITIDLTVTIPSMATITETVCGSYTAPDGEVYTTSGVKTAVIPNSVGCDSTITINLTVFNNTSSSLTRSSCGSFLAPNGQVLTTSGIYSITIPNAGGCDSLITINLTVNPTVNASTTSQGDTSITAFPANMSYQWINCATNAAVTSATNQIIQPISGTYAVVVTNSAGCSDTSTCVTISNTASLNENDFANLISVYPNPTEDLIYLSFPENQTFKLILVDMSGKILNTWNSSKSSETISLVNFDRGVYFIHFENETGTFTKRIVKQ